MRVEPFGVGSFVHAMKRGARGLPIVRNDADRRRFARLLYFANDKYQGENLERGTKGLGMFERPSDWPERQPLTRILSWVLMSNHFHLLLEEVEGGGVAKFMQRLCGSMSANFNAKYKEKGSLFQGGYKSRTVASDNHLRILAPYIMVKNVFELYPGGYEKAIKEFDKAWRWGVSSYEFSSLPEYAGNRGWPITEKGILKELFLDESSFRRHAKEIIFNRKVVSDEFQALSLD